MNSIVCPRLYIEVPIPDLDLGVLLLGPRQRKIRHLMNLEQSLSFAPF